ncbi:MAG: iron-containing alcohol dehydrogenase [Halieaceae bacterium]|nr:iron-containing alcohol dehydrogenase [Halieaceae bacterium]
MQRIVLSLMLRLKNSLFYVLANVLVALSPGASHLAFAGPGSARRLCRHIAAEGISRLLVVTDRPLRELGIVDEALRGFADSGVELAFYDGVKPDPDFDQVAEGAVILREHDCEAVLAIGGGSSIDCAKVIAACARSSEDPRRWIGLGKVKHEVLPIFAIPTTAGTGSEATMGAVISDPLSHEKGVITGRPLSVSATALDASLQLGMPPAITAATGMDALTHAIETWICRWNRGTARDDARRAIRMIFEALPRAYANGDDLDARETMATAAWYAGIAINQVNVGSVHAIAHQLGAKYGIPHGLANAMVLPHVLDYCAVEAEAGLAELADLIGAGAGMASSAQKARAFIDAVVALRDGVGIAATTDRIRPEDLDELVALSVKEAVAYFPPKLLTPDGARRILTAISSADSSVPSG